MLIGEYQHIIDQKRRLAIPSKLREDLGQKMVLTRGLDNCLFLFPMNEWSKVVEKLNQLPIGQEKTRSFVRLMLSGAVDIELDALGRILVPEYLKTYAGLGKQAVIAGLYNRLEIWDKVRWDNYKGKIEKNTDELAEKLGELGVF